MNRIAAALVATAAPVLAVAASVRPVCAAEPTYTIALGGKIKMHVAVSVQPAPNGGRVLRVAPLASNIAKSDLALSSELVMGADGVVQQCHVQFGPGPDTNAALGILTMGGSDMVAVRTGPDAFTLQSPARSGVLSYGAPLVIPIVSEIFLGRQYDWKKGGEQNYTFFQHDALRLSPQLHTIKLTADGVQTLNLADGPVKARRLKYHAPLAFLPKELADGVIFIGPLGEALQTDVPIVGPILKATGAAMRDGDNRSFAVRHATFALRAVDNGPKGWEARMETLEGQKLCSVWTDTLFRVRRFDAPWRDRAFRADMNGSEMRWNISAGVSAPTSGAKNAWFTPFWMITDAWEGPGTTFANLAVGAKASGIYFPLYTGETTGSPFTLERLPDAPASNPQSGDAILLHHYRFAGDNKNAYDLYTDGARLVLFTGSDATTITRDGWEAFAATVKPPVAPVAAPPQPAPSDPPLGDPAPVILDSQR